MVMLQWVIFPGLTTANSLINMLSVLIFIAMFLFDLNYVKETFFTKSETMSDEQIKQKLESELGPVIDEMAKEVLAKPKKKSNPKQFDGVKNDEPFVKTRSKPKTEKVMGEYQLNNKEKVRKSLHKTK
jgi:hypothetical protein